MDVVNGYLARKRKSAEETADIAHAGGWMAAAEVNGGSAADLQQIAPDETAGSEEKFGVYKETLFDFRDYGLD